MPFVDSSESLRARLHLSQVSVPVITGIVIIAVLAIVLVIQNIAGVINQNSLTIEKSAPQSTQEDTADAAAEEPVRVVVHVGGSVRAPGVYSLVEGSRVQDAIDAAGGFAEDAAIDSVNRARVISDGEQIIIASTDAAASSGLVGSSATTSAGSSAASSPSGGLVNINTATVEQLDSLPGIGASTAQKIIANRADEGPFQKKEDLMRVTGIGEKKYDALKDLITV